MGNVSLDAARRIALGAQGFNDSPPTGRVDRRHLRRIVDRMGIIQIDSVNVLVRSQELPLFSRLGPHKRSLIWKASADSELFEYWVHEASLVPVELHPLMRWKMNGPNSQKRLDELADRRPGYIDEVLKRLSSDGPLVGADLDELVAKSEKQGKKGSWGDWGDGKLALEVLFHAGQIAGVRRQNDFSRTYDLAERVIPPEILAMPTPTEADARKELLVRAARHHGIATFDDLTDYHRQRNPPCRPLVDELVEEGRLIETTVDGWKKPAYLHPDATRPRQITARALLSPFDPVVWHRDRAERLFGFRYRIEIYIPEAKRQYGYYVLPFLLGDELVARVDLKADRKTGELLVQGAYGEPGIKKSAVAGELAAELQSMADWLELERITVQSRGDLAPALRRAV